MKQSDLIRSDAVSLAKRIKSRDISCVEVMQDFLDHIDHCNPDVNAIVSRVDAGTLLASAAERDAQLAAGQYLGPLHGMPMAPKDLAAVRGMTTTHGSPIFRDTVPASDAIFVERLRKAGALFVGRTNTPEFGLGGQTYNTVFGTTRNAYDTSKTSGGSSGGAAVAVATHMLPFADGSDMMGSLRTPAAYNNVFGFRPTRGTVPQGPGPDLFFQQLAYDGPMARNVPDLALLLSVMAGYDARTPLSLHSDPQVYLQNLDRDVKGLKIGWLNDLGGYLPTEPGVLALCENALKTFEGMGCIVETIDAATLGFAPERLWSAWVTLRSFHMAGSLGAHYRNPAERDLLKPEAIWEIETGLKLAGTDVYRASTERSAWYTRLHDLFKQYDFVVLPSSQCFPFDAQCHWPAQIGGRAMDTYHRWLEVVIPSSLAGVPTLSVPAGFNADGLPMGIQILGASNADFAVMQLAHRFSVETGYHLRSPALAGVGRA